MSQNSGDDAFTPFLMSQNTGDDASQDFSINTMAPVFFDEKFDKFCEEDSAHLPDPGPLPVQRNDTESFFLPLQTRKRRDPFFSLSPEEETVWYEFERGEMPDLTPLPDTSPLPNRMHSSSQSRMADRDVNSAGATRKKRRGKHSPLSSLVTSHFDPGKKVSGAPPAPRAKKLVRLLFQHGRNKSDASSASSSDSTPKWGASASTLETSSSKKSTTSKNTSSAGKFTAKKLPAAF